MKPIIRKIPGMLLVLGVCAAAFLNSGTVRRKQTGVSKAQTAGIKLKDKLEEVKDGEKGPATPSFGWYGGKNSFMSEPPVSKDKDEPASEMVQEVPEVSEVEFLSPPASEAEGAPSEEQEPWDEDWAEDDLKEDEALTATADIEEAPDEEDSPQAADTSEDEKASKWDKDWWDDI